MLKLNGGLGTGMGLEKAKSLLEIKDGNTFLDFIAKQVSYLSTYRNAAVYVCACKYIPITLSLSQKYVYLSTAIHI